MSITKHLSPSDFSPDNKELSNNISSADIENIFTPNQAEKPIDSKIQRIVQFFDKLSESSYRSKIESITTNPKFRTLRQIFLTTCLASILIIAEHSDLISGQDYANHRSQSTKIYQRSSQSDTPKHRPSEISAPLSEKLNSCEDVASIYKLVKNLKSKDNQSPYITFNIDASSYYKGNDYHDKQGRQIELVATGKTFERGVDVAVDPAVIPYDSIVYVEYYDYRNLDLLDPVLKTKQIPGQQFINDQIYLNYILQKTNEKITIDIEGAHIFLGGRLACDTGDPDFITEDYRNTGTKRSLDISVSDIDHSNSFGIQPRNGQPDNENLFKQQIIAKFCQKYGVNIPSDRFNIVRHQEMKVVVIPPDTFDHPTKQSILNQTRSMKEQVEKSIIAHAKSE